jgi:2-C-methyl-D-erythritol 4-phosphate cytidylyltransferase
MNTFTSNIFDILKAASFDETSFDIDNVILTEKLQANFNSAIIVAAGNGTRMGKNHTQTKQMTELDGIPVVVRSIMQFDKCEFIDEIIVVAREDEIYNYADFQSKYGYSKVVSVVKGGSTRQKSVLEGIKALNSKSDYLAIHDGARCLITAEMIEKVIKHAYIYDCATAAEKSKDTVKKSDHGNFIDTTIDREYLWHAQTPQIFKTNIYRSAAFISDKNGFIVTDDCMVLENFGFKIKLVDCGYENIKITTPDDFYIAEAILKMRNSRRQQLYDPKDNSMD